MDIVAPVTHGARQSFESNSPDVSRLCLIVVRMVVRLSVLGHFKCHCTSQVQ